MNGGSSSTTGNSSGGSAALVTSRSTASPAPTATDAPPPTAVPTQSPSQYKKTAQNVGVADIAKDPNSYKGKPVMIQAVVLNFARDSNGNPVAANVDGPDFSGPIQIEFSSGLSVKNINENDTITVWGQGAGSFSGTNSFGATIQEGAIYEVYLHDSTTGYTDNSVDDPQAYVATLP
jgi:hypothetical protein